MRMVCDAAQKAARRNQDWHEHHPKEIHGVRGRKNRKIVGFVVAFGGGSRRYYLSSGGMLLSRISDGYIPLELTSLNCIQLNQIEQTLDTIAT